jgi:hypothetical protein
MTMMSLMTVTQSRLRQWIKKQLPMTPPKALRQPRAE